MENEIVEEGVSKEQMFNNVDAGLLPCGCEIDKCSCKISGLRYTLVYKDALVYFSKKNKDVMKKRRKSILKAFKDNVKEALKGKN